MAGNMFAARNISKNKNKLTPFSRIQPVHRVISYFFLQQPIRTALQADVS